MLRPLALACFVAAALTSGCTALVLHDDTTPAPCRGPGDCEAGFACQKSDARDPRDARDARDASDGSAASSVCTRVDDADSPPLPGVHVDAKGGDVDGAGITLFFDENAVSEDVQVDVREASDTNVAVGVVTRSTFFVIGPEAVLASRVVVTIAAPDCDGGCRVFKRPSDPGAAWPALDAGTGGAGKAAGVLQADDQLAGVYVAGVVTP